MNETYRPILVLDFDGVIHSYSSGWQGADKIPDPPVYGAAEFLEAAVEKFEVHILSSRSREVDGVRAMREWMVQQFGHPLVERLQFPLTKPAAFLTIDDRAICFDGTWPDVDELLTFKSWNKP